MCFDNQMLFSYFDMKFKMCIRDRDNDVLHAIDSAKRRVVEPAAQKVSKPQRLQKKEKQRDRLNDKKSKSNKKLNRQENKLNENHDKYKQRKKRKPQNKKTKKTVAESFKSAFKFVKNVYEKEVKKFFAAIAVPIPVSYTHLTCFLSDENSYRNVRGDLRYGCSRCSCDTLRTL